MLREMPGSFLKEFESDYEDFPFLQKVVYSGVLVKL